MTINTTTYLRIWAENVPSLGYKVYEIRPNPGTNFPNAVTVSGNTISNSVYNITVDSNGRISSIIDKLHNNKRLVK